MAEEKEYVVTVYYEKGRYPASWRYSVMYNGKGVGFGGDTRRWLAKVRAKSDIRYHKREMRKDRSTRVYWYR